MFRRHRVPHKLVPLHFFMRPRGVFGPLTAPCLHHVYWTDVIHTILSMVKVHKSKQGVVALTDFKCTAQHMWLHDMTSSAQYRWYAGPLTSRSFLFNCKTCSSGNESLLLRGSVFMLIICAGLLSATSGMLPSLSPSTTCAPAPAPAQVIVNNSLPDCVGNKNSPPTWVRQWFQEAAVVCGGRRRRGGDQAKLQVPTRQLRVRSAK
jgi:hypothetical protein